MNLPQIAAEIERCAMGADLAGEGLIADDLRRVKLALVGVGVAHFEYALEDFGVEGDAEG